MARAGLVDRRIGPRCHLVLTISSTSIYNRSSSLREEVLAKPNIGSRAVAQVNHLHLCAPLLTNLAHKIPAGRRHGALAASPAPTRSCRRAVFQEGEQYSSLRFSFRVSFDLLLVLFLGLGDDDVCVSASTLWGGPGAEVPGAAEIRAEVLIAEVSSVPEVAEGAGPCIDHLPLGIAEELLHLWML